MTVALLEIEQTVAGGEGVDDRLVRGIAGTVRELLTEAHTAGRYSDQQFLLLLPQDDLQHATQRAEQVRQRIAATQYLADGQQIPATVTCASPKYGVVRAQVRPSMAPTKMAAEAESRPSTLSNTGPWLFATAVASPVFFAMSARRRLRLRNT